VSFKRKKRRKRKKSAPFLSVALGWQTALPSLRSLCRWPPTISLPAEEESERLSPLHRIRRERKGGEGGHAVRGKWRRVEEAESSVVVGETMESSTEAGSSRGREWRREEEEEKEKRGSRRSRFPRRRILLQQPLLVQSDSVRPSVEPLRRRPPSLTYLHLLDLLLLNALFSLPTWLSFLPASEQQQQRTIDSTTTSCCRGWMRKRERENGDETAGGWKVVERGVGRVPLVPQRSSKLKRRSSRKRKKPPLPFSSFDQPQPAICAVDAKRVSN
jgi:hypothetical protein